MPKQKPGPLGKNRLNLTLPEVPKDANEQNHSENNTPDVTVERLVEDFKQLDSTDEQNERLRKFILSKHAVGELKQDDLENLCELGQGNGGVVWKTLHKPTKKIMARKVIYSEVKPAEKTRIMRELKVLDQCNSPYIVGFYGAFAAETQISICMEYMDGGSLDLIMKKVMRVPENILGRITVAVLRGFLYLRERLNIMHRDIKPSNILVNHQGEIKLCDFGVSAQLIDSTVQTFIGTRSYMAPERLEGENYKILSDIWSLGLSLVELAVGRYPLPPPAIEDIDRLFKEDPEGNRPRPEGFACYKGLAFFELMEWIVNESPPTLPRTHFSEEFCDLIDRSLKKSTAERSNLSTLLNHPFYKQYEKENDNQDVAAWVRQIYRTDPSIVNDNQQQPNGT